MTHEEDSITKEEAAEAARLAEALQNGRPDLAGDSAPVALLLSCVREEREDEVATRRLRSELVRRASEKRALAPWLWAAAAAVLVAVSASVVMSSRPHGDVSAETVAAKERAAAAAVSRLRASTESSAYASLARGRSHRLFSSLESSRFANLVPVSESAASPWILLLAAPLLAQEPREQPPPPSPGPDRVFFQAQILRAIEGKAILYMEQGKQEAALEELKKALAVDIPRDHLMFEANAHLVGMLAITYTNVGKKKEGVETIQKLLQEVPPGSVAEASATLDAGTVYRQAGMPDEALKAFDRAIELSQKLAARPPRGPAGRPMPPPPPGRPPGPPPKQ